MRDGVKLYTLILTPRKSPAPLPILLERTPYDATRALGGRPTLRLEVAQGTRYADGGYVFVAQDLRGRFKSEGDYAMYRVPRGAFNRTDTDETTDAWDTIDWLVKNVTPNNGKVGVWGTSYPGWLTLAALRDPHPALAAAVPFNPVVDVWKADDWFHWGAFRPGLRLRLHLLDGDPQGVVRRRTPTRRATCTPGCSSKGPSRTSDGASTTATRCGSG